MQARPSALRRERPRGGPTCVLTRVRGIWKWSIQHVPLTVVLNGPKQARKSGRNGPSSTPGSPSCSMDQKASQFLLGLGDSLLDERLVVSRRSETREGNERLKTERQDDSGQCQNDGNQSGRELVKSPEQPNPTNLSDQCRRQSEHLLAEHSSKATGADSPRCLRASASIHVIRVDLQSAHASMRAQPVQSRPSSYRGPGKPRSSERWEALRGRPKRRPSCSAPDDFACADKCRRRLGV